jgi:hypothetical protein
MTPSLTMSARFCPDPLSRAETFLAIICVRPVGRLWNLLKLKLFPYSEYHAALASFGGVC